HLLLVLLLPSVIRVLLPLLLLYFVFYSSRALRDLHSFPTRRSSDLGIDSTSVDHAQLTHKEFANQNVEFIETSYGNTIDKLDVRSEEHTSELQSRFDLVCRLLLEKKNNTTHIASLLKLPLSTSHR